MEPEKLTKDELLEEYRKLRMSRDRVFQIASHDLRSPFSGLLGVAGVMNSSLDSIPEDDLREYIRTIYDSLKNTYRLIENLVAWGRIERCKCDKVIEDIPLRFLADEVLEDTSEAAEAKEILIVPDFPDDLIVKTNSAMLEFVLKNFLLNAVKYSGRGSRVLIRSCLSEGRREISVTDDGVGISPANLEKLFKPEYSWKLNGTEGETGTGIGLIASGSYADYFGAELKADSTEGRGSVFTIILPESPA